MQLSVIELERREMLSASVALQAGVLKVQADDNGDYLIVQNVAPAKVEVLIASEDGKTYDFQAAQVKSILFRGGNGSFGDYFANLTALPSTQKAGNNTGVNFLQGGTGNDNITGDPNKASQTYITDPGGNNTIRGGNGFSNIFAGPGNNTITVGSGFTGLYDILGVNTINAQGTDGYGYLIVNAATTVNAGPYYQVINFFQPGVSGTSPGVPGGPSAILQPDVNGSGILYLNAASGQTTTSFVVNRDGDQIVVTYTDPTNGTKTFAFDHDDVSWLASFGPKGSNNSIINNTDINDVFYGGLPPGNHTVIGGSGINVLKGHSGTNQLTARGIYNDISAGAGTDNVVVQKSDRHLTEDDVFFEAHGDVIRARQSAVTTRISGFRNGDIVTGIPLSINDQRDRDTDTLADNADYLFWSLFLRNRGSI